MTPFQTVAVVLFVVLVVAAYYKELLAVLANLKNVRVPGVTPATDAAVKSAALVDDLVTVTELRERLAAAGCRDGADTCTNLLRVMIESNYQR